MGHSARRALTAEFPPSPRTLTLEEYFAHGKRHRPSIEGPAVLKIDSDGKCVQESYHEDDKCHRDPPQGPAWAGLQDGEYIEAYMMRGKHHRPEHDGPAVTRSDPETDRIKREEYAHDGGYHRVGGPAYIEYSADGSRITESWYRHGVRHRDALEGPACISKFDDGVQFEEYLVNGRYHRDPAVGPACIVRNAVGEVVSQTYWVNGEDHHDPGHGPAGVE